ncbi:MAG: 23S rRNA pseudouridine(1911/1915/1917) synthase RluD [Gammaproteobacteria bacterium]
MIYLEEQVPEYLDGQRSDIVASDLFPDYSRSRLQAWIKDGSLLVDGEQVRSKDRLIAGQHLRLQVQPDLQERWLPEDIPLTILFEDEHLLVVDKPVGMVVHPAAGNPDGTLLNALLHHAPETGNVPRAGIIHRIDKDTSGLLVVAKTVEAQTSLVRQLQKRTVKREYFCVAEGQFTAGSTIEAPVGRHPRSRLKKAVVTNGKPAVTHYRIEERFFGHTLLRVQLETGRTHQIRVHMEHIKHPLVGDQLYGGRAKVPAGISKELREYLRAFPRQALHAAQLTLTHPASGEVMSWQSPLPEDIRQLLDHLRKFDTEKAD